MRSRFLEQVILDIEVENYDLQVIIEIGIDIEKKKITDYEVWTTAENLCRRFFKFGESEYESSEDMSRDREEILNLVLGNLENDNISFDDVIDCLDEEE